MPVDLIAQSINATPSRIEKGNMSVITAKVKNVSIEDQKQVMIRITADDKTIYEVRKDMPANKPVSVGPVNWTGRQIGLHNMTVQVDPVNEVPDTNPGNNIASTGCTVYQRNGGGSSSGCSTSKTSTAKSSWTIPYRYIYEIAEVNRPLWKTAWVDYSEHLNVSTQINTKQGIATDQAHPKESDRESRGSWAIIPYAKQNSLNPNEVTRAGYGYELKVTTNYSTDWETKVPRGFNETARPIGGTYIGPTPGEAIAKFYDRNGNFINSIKLERTSGGNTGTAVWELPKREGVFLDGTKVWERKVYTDKDWSDGDVTVKVYVTAEGSKGHIEACTTNKLRIFGSMFDDTQNVRGRNF
ncbi:CARDB domain-containing protein [Paenibacillus polymyxa]|uniref:CARDB domain-containing protein n=1 Tax=Paenibacillus polymyxa TaxID=1406 RepID=UPI002E12A9F5